MSERKKYRRATPEEKLAAVKACLRGETNPFEAGKHLGVSRGLVYTWISLYRNKGEEEFFVVRRGNQYKSLYSAEFKQAVVEELHGSSYT